MSHPNQRQIQGQIQLHQQNLIVGWPESVNDATFFVTAPMVNLKVDLQILGDSSFLKLVSFDPFQRHGKFYKLEKVQSPSKLGTKCYQVSNWFA